MSPLSSQHAFVWCASNLRLAVAALCLSIFTQGCSTGPSEVENSCKANLDADGDGNAGCNDADCHRFELCRKPPPPDGEGGSSGGSSGQSGSDGSIPPVGGMSGGTVSPGGSGGVDETDDGGTEIDAGTCNCEADEVCTDAGCVPDPPSQPRYVIALMSAGSPIGLPGPPPDGLCVEAACREPGAGLPVGFCPCEPELYVRVIHITSPALDPSEQVVLTTKVQGTALSVLFDDTERAELPLRVGDKLRFELWDDNVIADDSLIYSCEPDLDALWPVFDDGARQAALECSVLSGALASETFTIRGTLVVQ